MKSKFSPAIRRVLRMVKLVDEYEEVVAELNRERRLMACDRPFFYGPLAVMAMRIKRSEIRAEDWLVDGGAK